MRIIFQHCIASGVRRLPASIVAICVIGLAACSQLDHHLNYPRETPPQGVVWSADFQRDQLLVHVEGARPSGGGPFPTSLAHPEEDAAATRMGGVTWDLAARGYVAIAYDYKRWRDGQWRRNVFAWRSYKALALPIDITRAYPEVDQDRIGALGFS